MVAMEKGIDSPDETRTRLQPVERMLQRLRKQAKRSCARPEYLEVFLRKVRGRAMGHDDLPATPQQTTERR